MPSVKNFDKNKKNTDKHADKKADKHGHEKGTPAKRRPGREQVEEYKAHVKVVEVEPVASAVNEASINEQNTSESQTETVSQESNKIEISFTGSELLRAKFPKPFEIAEAVATDWVNDGKFEGLPVGHPLAQVIAQQGLQTAKDLEKKVLNSPVTEKVVMEAFSAGMKAHSLFQDIKGKVLKK